ncbi:hypothetical protein [Rhizobium sp. NFR03]|uniref:hypothetical protein n=1 Tax=Rhizobium sp. NFR03 TaxID=1566263 RepID=UPI0008B49923|nr:hypothetical protein [Rhizobium sp. NFR03]SES39172.1 CDP-glycerol glycerophosphotransferase, TagB/SpsB family [Rhizobium sp. NFR03]
MKKKLTDIIIRSVLLALFVAVCVFVFRLDLVVTAIAAVVFYIVVLDLGGFVFTRRIWPQIVLRSLPKVAPKKGRKIALKVTPVMLEADMMRAVFAGCEFILYYDAPAKTTYQVTMWLPFLKMLDRPFVVVARQADSAKELRDLGINAIYLKSITDVDQALSGQRLKAVFYVNNGMRNMHMVRYNDKLHIQMLHGESDKPTSFNPVCKMYDILYVSGQLAIDRYHNNGVFIDDRQFRIVSRPQVGALSAAYRPGDAIDTVLYAPTWSGVYADQNLSSMPRAIEIVDRLMEAGFRVIFRPHPLSYKSTEDSAIIDAIADRMVAANAASDRPGAASGHLISNHERFQGLLPAANDCIDAAQFMISDVTSLVGDWLYTKKPFAVIDPTDDQAVFERDNALVRPAYYLDSALTQLPAVIDAVRNGDRLFARRVEWRAYALGVEDEQSPVDMFVSTTLDLLDNFDKQAFQRQLLEENQHRLSGRPALAGAAQ